MSELDTSIKALLRVISQIQSRSSGNVDFMKSSKPYWHLCIEKFHAAYIKAKNPDGFQDMFNTFFEKHLSKFTEEVIDEDGDINDEWLKNKEVQTPKGNKKKKTIDESSFSLRNINCRGEVIYFDESNEKVRNVSIPISEAYLAACKIYADGAKRGEYSPLPAQLLTALFSVMLEVCDKEYEKEVRKNVKSLKEIVEQLTNGEEENTSGTGSTLDPISGLLNQVKKKLNLGDNLDLSSLEKITSGLFDSDVTNKVKGIWDTFNEKVNLKEGADLSTIISNVSDAMKDGELQERLKGTIAEVASKVGMGEIKFTEQDKQEITPSDSNAEEQE
jgi:hypothetical protein